MAIHSTRSSRSSTSHRAIRGTSTSKTTVPMAYESKIPAGRYRSKIVSVTDSTTASGDDAIDVVYRLTSPTGVTYQMRERIPPRFLPVHLLRQRHDCGRAQPR